MTNPPLEASEPPPGMQPIQPSTFTIQHSLVVADQPLGVGRSGVHPAVQPGVLSDLLTLATFTDPDGIGTPTSYEVTILWGDGQSEVGQVIAIAGDPKTWAVMGRHQWNQVGRYDVVVLIHEKSAEPGWSGTFASFSSVTVALQPPFQVVRRTNNPDAATLVPVGSAVVALNTGGLRLAHALDFDRSPGTSVGMNPALVYNSDTVQPRPILEAWVNPFGRQVQNVVAQLTWNGTDQGTTTLLGTFGLGQFVPFSVQPIQSVAQTGVYSWTIGANVTFTDGTTQTYTQSGLTPVVVRDQSPFGAGWSLSTESRIVLDDHGALLVDGFGDTRYFVRRAGGRYASAADEFGQLLPACNGKLMYRTKDGTAWFFDTAGYLTRVTDRQGQLWSWSRTSDGGNVDRIAAPDAEQNPAQGTDPNTYSTGFSYTAGRATAITMPGNRTVHLGIETRPDNLADLTTIRDVDGTTRTLTYDTHRVTKDEWGTYSTSFGYTTAGTLGQVDQGEVAPGSRARWDFDTPSVRYLNPFLAGSTDPKWIGKAIVTDGRGHRTETGLDLEGRTLSVKTADEATTEYERNRAGLVVLVTDPLGKPTTFQYDDSRDGRWDLVRLFTADGGLANYRRDPGLFHQLRESTDLIGNRTVYQLNPHGDTTVIIDANEQRTTMTWENGLLRSITDALGHQTSYEYDTARRLHVVVRPDPNGPNRTTTLYDAAGNVQSVQNARGVTTQTVYDARNRLHVLVDALGGRTTTNYDVWGQVTDTFDVTGRHDRWQYDHRGWVTTITQAVGAGTQLERSTTLGYDAAGNVIRLTDALGYITSTSYDALNRVTRIDEASGTPRQRSTTFAYDLAGRLSATTVGIASQNNLERKNTTTFAYDDVGRLVGRTEAVGVTGVERRRASQYDRQGNLVWSDDWQGTRTSFGYDRLNRVVEIIEAHRQKEQRRTTFAYDALGQQVGQTTGLSDRDGYGKPAVTSYAYDALGRLTRLTQAVGTADQTWTEYRYDAQGNTTAHIDALGNTTSFAFDVLDRVTTITYRDGGDGSHDRISTMAYDRATRTTRVTGIDSVETSTKTDVLGRVTRVIRGNNLDAAWQQVTNYGYDAGDRLRWVNDAANVTMTLDYDELSRRTTMTTAAGTSDALTVIAIYDAQDALIDTTSAGVRTTFAYDALGRNRHTTEGVGNGLARTSHAEYDVMGRVETTTDAVGVKTRFVYDRLGRLTRAVEADGISALQRTTTTTFDAADNAVSVEYATGRIVTARYDALGRVRRVDDASLLLTYFDYDKAGQLLSTRAVTDLTSLAPDNAAGITTSFAYNAFGERTQTHEDYKPAQGSNPAVSQRVTSVEYDNAGRVKTSTDGRGTQTRFGYDPLGRLQTVNEADNRATSLKRTTTYAYDALDRRTVVTDATGVETRTEYDHQGRVHVVVEAANRPASTRRTTWTYDTDGRLDRQTNAAGVVTEHYYDGLGRQAGVTEALGTSVERHTQFGYDAGDRLLWQRDALGVITSFGYDLLGQRTKQIEAFGTTLTRETRFNHDRNGRGTEVVLPSHRWEGQTRRALTTLDVLGRVTDTSEEGRTTHTEYDTHGRVSTHTDERGTVTRFRYDTLGRRIEVIEAEGTDQQRHTKYEYDGNDNVIQVTDARGTVTRTEYDWLNRATTVTEALGVYGLQRTRTMEYDRLDRVVTLTTPLGYDAVTPPPGQFPILQLAPVVTTFAYDALGRRTETTEDTTGLRRLTTVVYDVLDRVVAQVNALGARTSFTHDELGRRTEVENPLQDTFTTHFDLLDRVIAQEDELDNRTTSVYDVLGRRVAQEAADGGTTTFQYNLANDLLVEINPVGKRTTYTYTVHGRAETVTDPLHQTTTYLYRNHGLDISSVTDPDGYKTSYETDAFGRRIFATDPAGKVEAYRFAADGWWSEVVDRDGRVRRTEYDILGRKTRETWIYPGNPNPTMYEFDYDAADRLRRASVNIEDHLDFEYDALGRQTRSEDELGIVLTSEYDLADRRIKVEDSFGGMVTSVYDLANQLKSRTLRYAPGESVRVDLTYTYRGEIESIERFASVDATDAGSITGYSYDNVGRLDQARHRFKGSTDWVGTSAEFDDAGRVTVERDTYSLTYRTVTYSYDTPHQSDGVEHFDAQNRLSKRWTTRYEYDHSGNRVGSHRELYSVYPLTTDFNFTTFTYDAAHRLTKARYETSFTLATSGGSLWSWETRYDYDALGRRDQLTESVEKVYPRPSVWEDLIHRVTTTVTYFSYDGGQVWADLNAQRDLSVRYLLGDRGERFARVRMDASGAHLNWYVTDRAGNTGFILTREGRPALAYRRGSPEGATSLADRWRFGGKESETVSGLLYGRGQHEDPSSGQMLGADRATLALGDTRPRRDHGEAAGSTDDGGGWWSTVGWVAGAAWSTFATGLYGLTGVSVPDIVGSRMQSASERNWWYNFSSRDVFGISDRARLDETRNGVLSDGLSGAAAEEETGVRLLSESLRVGDVWDRNAELMWSSKTGFADGITGGLSSWSRRHLQVDTVDYSSAAYQASWAVGMVAGLAVSAAVPPVGMGLGVVQAVGGALNAYDAAQAGDGFGALVGLGSLAVGGLGMAVNPCSLGSVLGTMWKGALIAPVAASVVQLQMAQSWEEVLQGAVGLGAGMTTAYALGRVCFCAGTPLRTPDGDKAIEAFKAGDAILSRDEYDVNGVVEVCVVEEVFERYGGVGELRVGGRVIRTTLEHPFFEQQKGWVACGELEEGDWLNTGEGGWVRVEGVRDTGEMEVVYNLRVSKHHTYFVGSTLWGFSVWSHNLCDEMRKILKKEGLYEGVDSGKVWLNNLSQRAFKRSLAEVHAAIEERFSGQPELMARMKTAATADWNAAQTRTTPVRGYPESP